MAALAAATLLLGLYLAVGALVGSIGTAGATVPAPRGAGVPAASYTVRPGDTLWSIARRMQPEGDVRPLVDQLAERNGGSSLQAGQRLDLSGLVAASSDGQGSDASSTGGGHDAPGR